MNDLPDDVLGITATGTITGADYEGTLIPAIEDKLQRHKKISLLYNITSEITDFELAAVWDDTKIGFKHLANWNKIALVSDNTMIHSLVKFFSHLIPCEVNVFNHAELPDAKQWVLSSSQA